VEPQARQPVLAAAPSRSTRRAACVALTLDQEIPPIALRRKETRYVKHVRMRSERLSKFWGRDMHLARVGAAAVGLRRAPRRALPARGQPRALPADVDGWRETPPDTTLKPDFSERFNLRGYNRIQQQLGYQLYKDWTGPDFPRVLLVQIQHATPYYDDSYAVNSANNGPYGDAIQYELIPEIERRFRGIGQGWARFDVRRLHRRLGGDGRADVLPRRVQRRVGRLPRPDRLPRLHGRRPLRGHERVLRRRAVEARAAPRAPQLPGPRLDHARADEPRELALGTRGRSGDQWDVWQAVYSPVGADGYPKPIWDKRTGAIDRAVAEHWREHYDLSHILRRDWATLGPKLRGKLRIYVGDMDNYYLNNAVYLVEDFLRTANPPADAVVDYGDRAEHCWNGDHTRPNAYSRLRYPQMVLPWAVRAHATTAPAGRRRAELALLTGAPPPGARRNARRPAASGLAAGRRAHWGGSPEGLF
jgi:hypothetical protein